ncbi:Malate synthase [Aphelenchoides fujianensis]|nr:Malate synthase [Aphelenchoides fujianensis]
MSQAVAKNFYQVVKAAPKGRYKGIKRNYEVEDVLKLRGSIDIEHTLAIRGANKLWQLIHTEPFVPALGALTGNQAVQMVRAGLKAIYLSGWQVAADANSVGDMYPDQSLYPANSGPELAKRINKALRRADQIECVESEDYQAQRDWYVPIVADAEAGFGGSLNCYELMKASSLFFPFGASGAYIEAGAAGVHFEDQLGSEKKCGHMGGKVLIPTSENIRHLNAARLAADVCGAPTIIDAESSRLLTSDVDEQDHPFIDWDAGRTAEGFFKLKEDTALQACIQRAKAYAPYSDMIWMETSHPTISDARAFAEGVREEFPDQLFAYNCSPSFNWRKHLRPQDMEKFQRELGAMGFAFQFITLAGFHANNFAVYDLARNYRERGMAAYSELQEKEFEAEREVGTGYFDYVGSAAAGGLSSTAALKGSTEESQFHVQTAPPDEDEIVTITAATDAGDEKILTPDALRFLKELHNKFEPQRRKLLNQRRVLQASIDSGEWYPDFDPKTADLRNDLSWKGASIPKDMNDRRVEITGPTDRKMVINALNSGARVFMADFEDSNSPSWRNQLEGQVNLYDAGSGPYFYLPKLENAQEAALWAEVFRFSEEKLGLPHGTIKCTILNEHLLATFQTDEIIHALRDHIIGVNFGRWDYLFSYIKVFRAHRKHLLPDRDALTMTSNFMRSAALHLIKTCHQRGIFAMGGMAAQIPIKHDQAANDRAMAAVRADKEREATDGNDGSWVAHPGLVYRSPRRSTTPSSRAPTKSTSCCPPSARTTACSPRCPRDRARNSDSAGTSPSRSATWTPWLRGVGCVPLYNLMDDAATVEISRSLLWQWLKHEAKLEDGRTVDPNLVKQTIAAETERRLIRAGSVVNRVPEAAELLEQMVLAEELPEFCTLVRLRQARCPRANKPPYAAFFSLFE